MYIMCITHSRGPMHNSGRKYNTSGSSAIMLLATCDALLLLFFWQKLLHCPTSLHLIFVSYCIITMTSFSSSSSSLQSDDNFCSHKCPRMSATHTAVTPVQQLHIEFFFFFFWIALHLLLRNINVRVCNLKHFGTYVK